MAQSDVLATLSPKHPRILIDDAILADVKRRIATRFDVARWYRHVRAEADDLLGQAPSHYEIPDGRRLLSVSRRVKERILALSLVHHVEGDRAYADRAWAEAAAACAFKDWNPSHFLDTAEMTYAIGTAYDWLFHVWTDAQRRTLVAAIVEKGLKPGLHVYAQDRGWHRNVNNWNQVCNGGLSLGALAVADVEPAIARDILRHAIDSIPLASTHYAPDGAGTEGVTYWDYGARYNCLFLSGLETALGTDFGLGDLEGFRESGDYQIYFAGAQRMSFDFADCGLRRMSTPMHFWMGRRFDTPRYSWYRWSELQGSERNGNVLDILWYDDRGRDFDVATLPTARHFRVAEAVTMRTGWDEDALVVALQGGDNSNLGGHRHLDLGSFILDALGERFILDSGTERETYQRHRHGNDKWFYYRVRAEGHNTLVFNPGHGPDQVMDATAAITSFSAKNGRSETSVDLSKAYAPHAKAVTRALVLDGQGLVLTDRIEAAGPNDLWWFAHTDADVALSRDGRHATLTRNGKRLSAGLAQPEGARFEVLPAAPFASSPNPPQSDDSDRRKLAAHLPGSGAVTLRVDFRPQP